MTCQLTAHIPPDSTDKTCMPGGEQGHDVADSTQSDDEKIRWLLAAVLHQDPDDDLDDCDG